MTLLYGHDDAFRRMQDFGRHGSHLVKGIREHHDLGGSVGTTDTSTGGTGDQQQSAFSTDHPTMIQNDNTTPNAPVDTTPLKPSHAPSVENSNTAKMFGSPPPPLQVKKPIKQETPQ